MSLQAGDRVSVRDRAWRVQGAEPYGPGRTLLRLLPADGDGVPPLTVVTPPERVTPLPPADLRFDLQGFTPVGPWLDAHRALMLTAVRDEALGGARFGRVNLEAYQIAPVLRILAQPRPRLLIADDVGLGKTIEAGLCLIELMHRRRADRVLVVVPPGLIPQWAEEELLGRFGLEFTVIENAAGLARAQERLPAGLSPWDLPTARIVTSMEYLKKPEVWRPALARPWDLVIVDEAHALAESGTPAHPARTQRTRLGERLRERARGLLLLTATPHNGYAHAFRSLIELVEPTAATISGARSPERIQRAMIRRMKRQIVRRTSEGGLVPAFHPRRVEGIRVPVSPDEARLFELITRYCSRTARAVRGTEDAELVAFAMQIIKKRALSSRLALKRTLEHRLDALRREGAREEKPAPGEVRELRAGLPVSDRQAERVSRRVLRSALPAEARARQAEIRSLTEIRRLLARFPQRDPKVEALLGYLHEVFRDEPRAKVIVFTEYLDTLEAIRTVLDAAGSPFRGAYVELRGGLSLRQRTRVQARFEEADVRLLLATDAASEGLNLQRVCHRLVHFELPWNPNRLEQRNGRIDRYGQQHPPEIRYLYYPDSPEDDVLARLVTKIEEMAASQVSTPDVLGVLTGLEIEERLTELSPEDSREALVRDFEDRTHEFAGTVGPLVLGGGDPVREITLGEEQLRQAEPLLPDDQELEALLATALGPRAFRPTGEPGIYCLEVPKALRGPGVAERYERATCRRSVAARTPADEIEYLTPLHALVQAIAAQARRQLLQVYPDDRGLPPRRLAARCVPREHPPAVLFTFFGRVSGPDGVIEERVIPVRLDVRGRLLGDPASDLDVLLRAAQDPGEVPPGLLAPFAERFADLAAAAAREAERRLQALAAGIRERRRRLAETLRTDAEAFRQDRLRELEDEELRGRGQIETTGQVRLWAAEDRARYSVEARRAAVETHVNARREEIAAFEQVDAPEAPAPLGALLLVPERG
ncbi:MAG TPA: helicase-related protein [Vicinamibacterales bacterium]|nr:helicase-related protein [Vicinamibacterales bacterium]